MTQRRLARLLREVRGCQICAASLPHPPNPVVRAHADARLLLVGQAPGRKVHETGIPWNDPSGDTLREWLQMSREEFYDERILALVPAGFCFPGKGKQGDLPPRPECGPAWHPRIRELLPKVQLTLLLGSYAQALYLKDRRKRSLTETVASFEQYLPEFIPLPHPSPRNRLWLRKNAWFERDLLPVLRHRIETIRNSP